MALMLFLGAIAFLIMVHPLIFFLLVVPLAIIGTMGIIRWLKK
jgi:hypothetical protein